MSEIDWYYFSDGRHKGPISESELKELFLSYAIPIHTQVWTESMTSWSSASNIEPFRSLMLKNSNLEKQISNLQKNVSEIHPLNSPVDSLTHTYFEHLKVRSLIVWAILGFVLLLSILYFSPITKKIHNNNLIALLFFCLLEIWLLLWIIWKLCKYKIPFKSFLGKFPKEKYWLNWVLIPFGLFIFSFGTFCLFWYPFSFIFPNYFEKNLLQNDSFVYSKPILYKILVCFYFLFVAPFVEELIFRGIIFPRWATKWGIRRSIVLSSIMFVLFTLKI